MNQTQNGEELQELPTTLNLPGTAPAQPHSWGVKILGIEHPFFGSLEPSVSCRPGAASAVDAAGDWLECQGLSHTTELPTCSLAVAKANSRVQLLRNTLGKSQAARLVLE